MFPVRLGNLGAIRIGENLIRPGGPGTPYWLVFSRYDVKNRIRLETVFDADVTELIDNYVDNHLQLLLRGNNEPWLFPGMKGRPQGLGHVEQPDYQAHREGDGPRHHRAPIQTRGGGFDPEGKARKLRVRAQNPRPPQYPDHDQFLYRP